MSKVLITRSKLDNLANTISSKSGEPLPLTIDEMDAAVESISGGGVDTSQDTVDAAHLLSGYTAHNSQGQQITGSYNPPTFATQSKTATPTESAQTITPDTGYDGLSSVQINAMPTASFWTGITPEYYNGGNQRYWKATAFTEIDTSQGDSPGYVPEGLWVGDEPLIYPAIPTGTTVTPSTSAQTIGGANYMMEGAVTVAAMPSGAVSASATKGSVSNHAISVTPTATVGTAGYLAAGSTNGTAVSVSASELVSGNLEITENGTGINVVNYETVSVAVSGGTGSLTVSTKTATLSAAASAISFTGLSGNPLSFVITSSADQSTGGAKVVSVAYDGTSFHGMDVTTQAEADTGFTKSYSNGTLTVTATTATFEANEYKLVYTYGGSSSDIHTSDVQVGSGATSITFTGLSGKPAYFSCVFKSSFSTSSGYQRVIDVVNDGTSTYGHAFDSSAKAQTSWSYTYSGGSLTITSSGTNQGGYFHQPGYYQLTYAVDDSAPQYQAKSAYATTTAQTITPDSGYDALESVSIGAISQTNLTAANIKSGTTVSISNGSTNLWSVTGTYEGSGGGSVTIKTTTMTNNSATATQIQFTSLTGQPKAFFCRCTSNLSRNSSNRYYYIADIRWDGSSTGGVAGNKYYVYNGQYSNQTTGYSQSYSDGTLTLTTTGSQTASPGSFYNGTYELVYVY